MKPLLRIYGTLVMLLTTLLLLNNCGGGGGGGKVVVPVTSGPVVIATAPAANATGVATNTIAVSATFSKAMSPATITTTTFTLTNKATGSKVTGTVELSVDGTVATFKPTSPATDILPATTYSVTISNAVQDLAGNHLASDFTWSFTIGTAADLLAPNVTLTTPVNGTANVVINELVSVVFTEPVLASSVNTSTFTLTNNTTGLSVPGTVSFDGRTIATFAPTGVLATGPLAPLGYTAAITGIKDLANNSMPGTFSFTFFTGTTADTTLPTVTASSPANNDTNVLVNTPITVTFSEPMNIASINAATFTLNSVAGPIPGTVSVAASGTSATFSPTSQLLGKTTYMATITTGVTDQAGNHLLSNFTDTFSTDFDTIPPTVVSTVPAPGGTNVPRTNPTISVTFDEPMDPRTINSTTITLSSALTSFVSANVFLSLDGTTAQIVPLFPFIFTGDTITATVTTNVTDLAGNKLVTPFSWSFTTGP